MRTFSRAIAGLVVLLCSLGLAQAQAPLRVGVPAGVAGWSFKNAATGADEGIVYDLVRALGPELGAVEFQPMPFGDLIRTLNDAKIDLIAGNLTVTAEREKLVRFSKPFFVGADGLVVAASDTTAYATWEDLRGVAVGTFAGSIYVEPMRTSGLFAEVKVYTSPDDLVRAVDAGEIKAGVGPGVSLGYIVSRGIFPNVRFVRSYQPKFRSNIALAVRTSETGLLERVNAGLDRLQRDGEIAAIFKRWGQ